MWIGKKLAAARKNEAVQTAGVTASQSGFFEANGAGGIRLSEFYLPYGLRTLAPKGEEVLVLSDGAKRLACGCRTDLSDLDSGEIELRSAGGACIRLHNDGCVTINGLKISPLGEIENGE